MRSDAILVRFRLSNRLRPHYSANSLIFLILFSDNSLISIILFVLALPLPGSPFPLFPLLYWMALPLMICAHLVWFIYAIFLPLSAADQHAHDLLSHDSQSISPLSVRSSPSRGIATTSDEDRFFVRAPPEQFHLSRYDPTSTAAHLANQHAEKHEPTTTIFDHNSLRIWLQQWEQYKNHGGTKPLMLLLSRPRGTSSPGVCIFSSLCWNLTPTQREDERAHCIYT